MNLYGKCKLNKARSALNIPYFSNVRKAKTPNYRTFTGISTKNSKAFTAKKRYLANYPVKKKLVRRRFLWYSRHLFCLFTEV